MGLGWALRTDAGAKGKSQALTPAPNPITISCPFTQRSKERFPGDVDLVNVTGNK